MLVLRLPARFPLRFLIALALGCLHAASFLDGHAWPLQIVALAGLFAMNARAPDAWPAARGGFAFGLGWFLSGIWWIYISLHDFGEMAAPIAAAATFLLCVYLALFPALACGLTALAQMRSRVSPAGAALLLMPALWGLSEWLRGTLFTGFPWLGGGYAHVDSPLGGYAPLIGVYGIALLAALMAGALALLGNRRLPRGRRAARFALLALLATPLAGAALRQIDWSSAVGTPLRVKLLQGNIAQNIKFIESSFGDTVDTYLRLIEQGPPADLIILPETALPRLLDVIPAEVLTRLRDDSHKRNAAIALGVPIADGPDLYFNSVIAFAPGSDVVQRYDKSHLVPFGEFVPVGFHWFVALMQMPLGDFTRGSVRQQPMTLAGARIAFNVCYEDLFGVEIARQAGAANILVNVSNVAWFGNSIALPQHLQISRMRALEMARPMLRATNTGMTAAIDARGGVIAALAPFTEAALDVSVQGTTGTTPYARWTDWPALLLALALAVLAIVPGWRRAGVPRRQPGD